jgi:hypothetical protein
MNPGTASLLAHVRALLEAAERRNADQRNDYDRWYGETAPLCAPTHRGRPRPTH